MKSGRTKALPTFVNVLQLDLTLLVQHQKTLVPFSPISLQKRISTTERISIKTAIKQEGSLTCYKSESNNHLTCKRA